jgi:hypothetical protein
MKLGELKSVGHNIADSFASGIGLLIGHYEMNVFAEAASEPEGFVVVDFLEGSTNPQMVTSEFLESASAGVADCANAMNNPVAVRCQATPNPSIERRIKIHTHRRY